MLLGFAVPDEGHVRVGGRDLGDLDLERWRSRIAWVPQRPHLFADTIAENVRLARPDADDEAVLTALRDAGAYDFVAALPDGVRTALGEDGAGLSAGQRQRLALARAFLADRPLLLLDEPTASLDGESEAGIVDAVRRLAAGRTVLLVVHRPALLAVADRVVTLEPRTGALRSRTRRCSRASPPRGPRYPSPSRAVNSSTPAGRTPPTPSGRPAAAPDRCWPGSARRPGHSAGG